MFSTSWSRLNDNEMLICTHTHTHIYLYLYFICIHENKTFETLTQNDDCGVSMWANSSVAGEQFKFLIRKFIISNEQLRPQIKVHTNKLSITLLYDAGTIGTNTHTHISMWLSRWMLLISVYNIRCDEHFWTLHQNTYRWNWILKGLWIINDTKLSNFLPNKLRQWSVLMSTEYIIAILLCTLSLCVKYDYCIFYSVHLYLIASIHKNLQIKKLHFNFVRTVTLLFLMRLCFVFLFIFFLHTLYLLRQRYDSNHQEKTAHKRVHDVDFSDFWYTI